MKTAIHIQYSQEALQDIEEAKTATSMFVGQIRTAFETQRRDLLYKKSIRVLKWNMQAGYNGDDFAKNMVSVVFTGKGYRVPRIVKRLFKKK